MSKNPLLLFAAVLALIAIAVVLLLSMRWPLGWWLLGGFLVAHGCVHLFFVTPGSYEAAEAGRRLGLTAGETRLIGTVLVAMVAVGFLFAGLTTVVPSGWWSLLVVVSSVASLALLALFFSRQLILGFVIDAVLLAVVVVGVWTP
jgi:hypothetical protein